MQNNLTKYINIGIGYLDCIVYTMWMKLLRKVIYLDIKFTNKFLKRKHNTTRKRNFYDTLYIDLHVISISITIIKRKFLSRKYSPWWNSYWKGKGSTYVAILNAYFTQRPLFYYPNQHHLQKRGKNLIGSIMICK